MACLNPEIERVGMSFLNLLIGHRHSSVTVKTHFRSFLQDDTIGPIGQPGVMQATTAGKQRRTQNITKHHGLHPTSRRLPPSITWCSATAGTPCEGSIAETQRRTTGAAGRQTPVVGENGVVGRVEARQ